MIPLLLVLGLAMSPLLPQVPPVGEGKYTGSGWCQKHGQWRNDFDPERTGHSCPGCRREAKASGSSGASSSSSSDVFADAMAKGIVHGDAQLFTAGLAGSLMGSFMDSLFSSGSSGPSAAEIAEMERREAERREVIRREMERQRLVRVGSAREMRSEMERSDAERSSRLDGIFNIVKPKKSSDYVGAWSDGPVASNEPWTDTSVVDLRPDHAARNRREEAMRTGIVMPGGDGLSMVIDPRMMGQDAAGQEARDRFAMERSSGRMPDPRGGDWRGETWDRMHEDMRDGVTDYAKDHAKEMAGDYIGEKVDAFKEKYYLPDMPQAPDLDSRHKGIRDELVDRVVNRVATPVLNTISDAAANRITSDEAFDRLKSIGGETKDWAKTSAVNTIKDHVYDVLPSGEVWRKADAKVTEVVDTVKTKWERYSEPYKAEVQRRKAASGE